MEGISVKEQELILQFDFTRMFIAEEEEEEEEASIVVSIKDVTERKLAESKLRESEESYRTIVEGTNACLFRIDRRGRFTFVNEAAQRTLGYTKEELIGKFYLKYVHPEDKKRIHKLFLNQMLTGVTTVIIEFRFIRKNGSIGWFMFLVNPVLENKHIIGLAGVAQDITERKHMEKLQESLYRISRAVDSSESLDDLYKAVYKIIQGIMPTDNFYIAIYDRKNNLLSFPYFVDEKNSTAAPRKFGKGITEYVLRTKKSLLCCKKEQEEMERNGEIEIFGRFSDIWLGVPLKVENETIGVMALQHYTDPGAYGEQEKNILEFISEQLAKAIEHKRAEEDLRKGEEKLSGIIQSIPDFMSIIDEDYNIVWANEVAKGTYGVDIIERRCYEAYHRFDKPCEHCIVREVFADGKIHKHEAATIDKDGNKVYQLSVASVTSRYPDKRPKTVIEISRDITEQKQLEEQFRQSQKMEGIGRLAGGVAHDFNNLLTIISGNAELSLTALDPRDPMRDDLKEIQHAADRAADLTRQLLAFSRKQTLQPKILNLNSLITGLNKMLRRIIGEDIDLKTFPGRDLWNVKADPGQMEQVIINLAVNARDAMPKGGKLTIETQDVELDEKYAKSHADITPGPHVMLAISDTGSGMTNEVKAQIFDPFFTTKSMGEGTGLGLSTVYGIVKQSGGSIWVYSEVGVGTAFKIYLPKVEEVAEEFVREVGVAELPRGTETVLVVEDEDGVRHLACRVLKRQGYTVLEARTGGDAYLLCQKREKPVDLVITDVIMPNMGGVEFVEKLREIWTDFKVLFMSGYTANAIVHRGELDVHTPYLQKPFHPVAFAMEVRRVLDG